MAVIFKNKKQINMADVNVVKVEGIPLEKLIEVISKGIGTIYKPRPSMKGRLNLVPA